MTTLKLQQKEHQKFAKTGKILTAKAKKKTDEPTNRK